MQDVNEQTLCQRETYMYEGVTSKNIPSDFRNFRFMKLIPYRTFMTDHDESAVRERLRFTYRYKRFV